MPVDADEKAMNAAAWFADFKEFRSHGRRVSRDDARGQGLTVTDLEADQAFEDAVLSVHHAVRHTFGGTVGREVDENHKGRAYVELTQTLVVQGKQPSGPVVTDPPQPQPPRARARKKRR